MERAFRTTRGEYTATRNRYREVGSGEENFDLYSASLVGEERGYILGVEDERKKLREKLCHIISNLKARGYPLRDIAEDTGLTLDEIKVI